MTDIIEVDGVMFDEGKIRHYRGLLDKYDHERQLYKSMSDSLNKAAENLIVSVMSRYKLSSVDELTCPYMKELAACLLEEGRIYEK